VIPVFRTVFQSTVNLTVTLLLWAYFTLGFVIFFAPFYLIVYLFPGMREKGFQTLNHYFYKGFFLLVRLLMPRLSFRIDERVKQIRSAVIVCNHLSYLDPLLLISLFKRQRTIVKSTFFKVPIFGWLLKASGYIPSTTGGALTSLMIHRMESMKDYLDGGGNLFIFPEGTRSRQGELGGFNKGAFSIARYCRAPIKILAIKNSNCLFSPGSFLFQTLRENTIEVNLIGDITPDYSNPEFTVTTLIDQVRSLFQKL
jgi:1-acyl-sn-glycerol-3-phosphate acyltransferase